MPFNGNPQQMVMQLMQQNMQGNPMFSNLLLLAQQGKNMDIETIAKNICKENNIDFDKEFQSFKQNFGISK
jgi:hypothetical protein